MLSALSFVAIDIAPLGRLEAHILNALMAELVDARGSGPRE